MTQKRQPILAQTEVLVGSTGFVGGNLLAAHKFSVAVHSTDLQTAFGTAPELCVYAGVPAAMFLANADPAADLAVMAAARENLRRIGAKQTVLISSIAVYAATKGKDETSLMACPGEPPLSAYGANRLQLERWVQEDFPQALIVRLPALYGRGLKKNFLYDLHTITPAMLRPERYVALAEQSELVRGAYSQPEGAEPNAFYRLNGTANPGELRRFFAQNEFNALSFTDSRSRYQFYPLARLWQDIQTALRHKLTVLNLTTPPVSAAEVYTAATGRNNWKNELPRPPFDYDLHSCYAELLAGHNGYLCSRQQELDDVCAFLRDWA